MKFSDDETKTRLCKELEQKRIKHNPSFIIRIAKTKSNLIIFLEQGNIKAGFIHIVENHSIDFLNRGISSQQIPDFIMTAVIDGNLIGIQGKSRQIYEFIFNELTHYLSVEIASNGYIVSANPTPTRLITKYKRGFQK
ncbi:hypothetical protein [Crocosphaera sp.]|uniref:hypothetical protein n=1 Tax=Crocosphaera sp. TaxID=2729996 RepID=UPI002629236C|nr:hypothetical protein [Crocosphaera sp.]MDJ0580367.1 hypothetical protein [Crocosphaera sp.]